jgi:hypothetical protein
MLVCVHADGVYGSQVLDPFGPVLAWPRSPATGCALGALIGLLCGSFGWGGSLGHGLPTAEFIQARSGAVPSSPAPSGSATPGVWLSSDHRSLLAGLVPMAVGHGLAWSGCFWAALVVVW